MSDAIRSSLPRPAVPDIIIGGAPRSGTTFLCELLNKHPGVYVARPIVPEPKVCLTPHPRGNAGLLDRYAYYFTDVPPDLVRIEKTTNYFENDEARERLANLLPDVRFIFIVREPVRRAYSNWLWSRKNGLENLPFAEAIRLEGQRPSPLAPERAHARPFDYMTRGHYGTLAEAWLRRFGADRIAFFVLEQALDEPDVFAAELQRFLGVKPLPWVELRTGKINATEPDPKGLDPALANELRERIAGEVNHFAKVTGVDVSIWGY
jgi:hypothetical protein